MDNHGIADAIIIDKYQLGFVSEPLRGDERFKGMLAIPYLSPTGVVAMKYRRLDRKPGQSKYAQPHGQKPRLYNTRAYFEADHVIGLAEGEIDAIVASERLSIPTMGIPGVDVWAQRSSDWRPLFKDYRLVCVFVDGDEAGHRLGDLVAETLGHRARIIACDAGEDVSSAVTAGKADTLCQLARE